MGFISLRRVAALLGGVFCLVVVFGLATSESINAEALPNTGAPQGFSISTVSNGGLDTPVNARFAPDGRIFVIEKGGGVRIVKNGVTLPQPFYTVQNVSNYVDRGLLGLALDPNFATNGYVYLLFTYDNNPANPDAAKTGRLIRVTANGDVAVPGSEVTILGSVVGTAAQPSCQNYPVNTDCLPADGLSHAPGGLAFGPDGKLYVTIGDAASYDDVDPLALRAQNVDSFAGKVLRINSDGTGVADNPYYNGPDNVRSKVWAMGVRNSFRLNVRASDGLVTLGDVGWNGWEEINTVPKAANLGWPCWEGNEQQNGAGGPTGAYKDLAACQQLYQTPPAGLKFPTHLYPHPPGAAVVGGFFYEGDNYPASFKNRYFFGDYVHSKIYSLALDGSNNLVPGSAATFASNAAGPVAFFEGPEGDIYYVGIYTGQLYRISYSTANQAPIAVASSDKVSGPSPLTVNFSSSGSTDPENGDLFYSWDFGDESEVSNEPNPAHTFTVDGTYNVTLTVTDEFNNVDTETITIHAGQTAPTVTIDSPANFFVATPGQTVNFSGTATDVQDGTIAPEKLNWTAIIQHCPLDSCHSHTMFTYSGTGNAFTFPAHDGPYYVQLNLSVTDSSGLNTTKTVSVYPQGQPIIHAMQFDGVNDYATAENPQDFKLQEFSAEAMIKTFATDTEGSEIISMGNNWIIRLAWGNVYFIYVSGGVEHVISTGEVNVVDGTWHHIAVTKSATTDKLFIDGVLRAQAPAAPIDYNFGNDLTIARHAQGNDRYNFNGAIDEVRFWSVARTDAEIGTYRSTLLPASGNTGLVAYYKAEEGTGNTVADSATAAHKLTLLNGTNWTGGAPLSSPTSPPPTTNPITGLQDTFTGTILDTAKWARVGTASRTTQNEALNITLPANATGTFGVRSVKAYELKDNAVYVEVPQVTNVANGAETQFMVELDTKNRIIIGRNKQGMYFRRRINGTNSNTTLAYNATSMRWWRIREAAGTIHLETSPDAATWTIRRSFAKPFDLTNVKVLMLASAGQAVASPGAAKFDSLNVSSVAPPVPATNNAMSFNGSTGKASVAGAPFNLQTFTIETWAKVQATGTGGAEVISNGNNWGLRVEPSGNLVFFTHTGGEVWNQYVVSAVNLKDNAWHHIAVAKDAATLRVYIDGVLQETFVAPETISYTLGTNMVLGQHSEGDPNFNLTGVLDEVRIWNVARTTAQIQADRQKEVAAQAGLVGYWQANETTGLSAADLSGNNRPLTLTAGVTWVAGFPKQ